MMRRALIGAVLCIASSGARAEPPPSPEAQAHIDAGVTAFNAKDYGSASREFEAAYALAPLPKLLFGWAQARRLGGHCDEAIPLYRRYLATKPTDEQIEAATTAMLLCEQSTAPAPVVTPPPRVDVIRHEPAPWYRDKVGGVLAASGVVSVAVGATFLVLASHSEDAATSSPMRADFIDLLDEATLRRRIGWAGIGIGSGLLLGSVIRYLTHDEPARVEVVATGRSIALFARF